LRDPVTYARRVMLANAVLAAIAFWAFAVGQGEVEAIAIVLVFAFSLVAYVASRRRG